MPDINALWQQARGMSAQQLMDAIAGKTPGMPAFVAAPRLMEQKQLEEAARLQRGAKNPQSTVIGDLEKEFTGVGGLPPGGLSPPMDLRTGMPATEPPPGSNVIDPNAVNTGGMADMDPGRVADIWGKTGTTNQSINAKGYADGGIVNAYRDGAGMARPDEDNPMGLENPGPFSELEQAFGLPANRSTAFMSRLMRQQYRKPVTLKRGGPDPDEEEDFQTGMPFMNEGRQVHSYAGGGLVSLARGGEVDSFPAWLANTVVGRQGYDLSNIPKALWDRNFDAKFDPMAGAFDVGQAPPPSMGARAYGGTGADDEAMARSGPPVVAPGQNGIAGLPSVAMPPPRVGGGGNAGSMMDRIMGKVRSNFNALDPGAAQRLKDAEYDANMSDEDRLNNRQAMLERAGVKGQALEGLNTDLQKMQADLADRKSSRLGQALLEAGLKTMAGKSPYFLSNVGEGGAAGLQQYLQSEKLDNEDKMKLTQLGATVETARRAESIGNVDAVLKSKQESKKIFADMSNHAQAVAAHLFGSALGYEGQIESANTHAGAAMAGVRENAALRKQLGDQAHLDRADKLASDNLNRTTGIEKDIFKDAYDKTRAKLDEPTSMAFQKTAAEKDALAQESALTLLRAWRNKDKGIAGLPSVKPVSGTVGADGKLIQ